MPSVPLVKQPPDVEANENSKSSSFAKRGFRTCNRRWVSQQKSRHRVEMIGDGFSRKAARDTQGRTKEFAGVVCRVGLATNFDESTYRLHDSIPRPYNEDGPCPR